MNVENERHYKGAVSLLISYAFELNMRASIKDGKVNLLLSAVKHYELENYASSKLRANTALNALINIKLLKQEDLHMIGTQGVVSELVNGKRDLNIRQINALAKEFDVNPYIFL
jgi:HTH-type transcriptional regulator/antitoxin HigA